MKQRLLTAALLLAATLAAWAQNWTAPVNPATGVDPVDGGTYYIKNVGCGQYIVGANSWATQISVSTDYSPYFSVVTEAVYEQEQGNSEEYVDVTSTYITNANFASGTPLDGGVCTYDYNIESNAASGALYSGMLAVGYWTAGNLNENSRASGVFAVGSGSTIWLGGSDYTVPATNSNSNASGNVLGLLAVWGASAQYTQAVTLPAGTYTITFPIYNGGGTGTVSKNLFGFIADSGTEHLCTTKSFAIGKWTAESVTFTLTEETSGSISLGYASGNVGSGSMPHLWIDGVQLKKLTGNSQQQLVGYKLKMNGTFYFSGDHNRVDFEVSNKYLFRDSETSGFVDLGNQARSAIWVLTKDANGYYRIQSTTENNLFPDAASQYAYAREPGQAVEFNRTLSNSGGVKYIEWEFVPSSVSTDDIALYGARKALYDALVKAYNMEVDYSSASQVYENSSDITEINNATSALQQAIDAATPAVVYIETDYTSHLGITANDWAGASGLCATQFAPAITTKDGRTAQLAENYQTNVNATGDLITQTVTGLANGTYRVSIYANAFYTAGRGFDSDIEDGAEDVCYVFAGKGENRVEQFITARIATATEQNDLRTLNNVKVTDGTLVVGLGKAKAGTNWHTVQVYEITAVVNASELLELANGEYEEVKDKLMQATVAEALATAKGNVDEEVTSETLNAFNSAIAAAQASATAYQKAANNLEMMKALTEANNVYTTAAYNEYYGQWAAALANQTLTTAETNALENPNVVTGWHANTTVDNFLLSAWDTNPDFEDAPYYINTWSVEGANDGSDFRVPFFEYWTDDDALLGERTLTATVGGLEAGMYEVKAWVRVRTSNDISVSEAYGITLAVNDGTAVDVTKGEIIDDTQFRLAEYKVYGEVGDDGILKIKFNVDADNTISWLSFKNVHYRKVDITTLNYENALEFIQAGENYRIYIKSSSNQKYYMKSDGYLTATKAESKVFTFTPVTVNDSQFATGWNLGCKFTNPILSNGSSGDIQNQGHIIVGGNNRDTWERQAFLYNGEAFAVRATNSTGTAWGANTYWDVFENNELPEAGYSIEPAYVWYLETEDAPEDYSDRDAAVAGITGAEGGLDVTQWIVNPTPTSSYEGWNWSATTTFDPGNNVAEYWQQSGASFSQTIPYLPAGYYILTAQALTRTNMKAYLSMTVGEVENKVEVATVSSTVVDSRAQANTWFNEGNGINEVRFQVPTSGEATIKLTADNTTSDYWLVWRGFSLRYVGTEGFDAYNQTLCSALIAEISQIATDASALLEQNMDAEVKATLEGLITDAGDLDNESYNALVAFKKALLAGIENANNSISYYKTLLPYITEAEEVVAKLDNFAAAKEAVEAHLSDMTTAYNNGTATAEMVETWMGKATTLARENMDWTKVDEGTDISFLIQNPHFKFGQYGPNETSTYSGNESSTPGWTVNSGAIKELRAATHNIEAWHQMFDFSQTLPNMPAGVYDLTLQGFVRHDNVQITDKTYLYAGVSTRAIMQCTDQWNTEPIYYEGVEMLGDDHYDVEHQQEEGPSHWVDNGMSGSYYWFQTVNPRAEEQGGQEGDCYYTNHLKVILAQDGNFTIGLHCDTNTDWVIWDNFQLKYLGNPASLYTETIYEKLDSLKNEINVCQNLMPTSGIGQQLYLTMNEQADDAIATGKEEACLQILDVLDETITDVRNTTACATTFIDKTNTINQSVAGQHSSDHSIKTLLADAYRYINREKVFADSTAIKTFMAEMDEAYTVFQAGIFDPSQIQTLIADLRQRQNEKVLSDELYQEIEAEINVAQNAYNGTSASTTEVQDGRAYYIYCDNDEQQWFYNNEGSLAVSNSKVEGDNAYLWTCSYDGDYWTFSNGAGGYFGFKEIADAPYNYTISTEQAIREGRVTMWGVNNERYLVIKDNGAFDQATAPIFDKEDTDFSSDFVFVEYLSHDVATSYNDDVMLACIDSLTTLCSKADAYHASVEAQLAELPVGKDLTAVLMNPSYNLGETGWVADNMKQQGGATMGCVITTTHTSDGITLSTFAESWNGGGQPVLDASIRQTTRVELPEGTYALDADIITQTDDELVQNVFMFIEVTDEQTQQTTMVKQPIRVNGGQPGHSQMVFNHKGGKLTFGVCYENTNATWVGMDNWKLSVSTAPDATDIAILAQAYEQMKGTQGDVLGWNLETNPTGLAGVIYTNGHVTAIDLAGYGLDGQFPSALLMLPQIEKIDLHNNGLQGSIDVSLAALAQMAGTQTPTSVLKKLNISENDLSGNVGLIGAVCPQLTQLLAADNHISGLMPALPEGIDQSDFSKFDLRNQTVSEPFTFNMAETDMQAVLEATPTLVTYPLLQKQADLVSMNLSTLEEDEFEKYNSALLKLSTEGAVISDLDHEYRGPISAQFELTLTEGPVRGSTLMCNLMFAPGDANLSGAVNVFDLQTDINYIFGDEVEMFNFTAADLYVDRNINVQDIVLLVDTIMSQEEETPAGVKSFDPTLIAEEEETETDAQLFWRGHELVLSSKVPVAAADIRLSADDVEWNIPGFNITAKHGRAIIYSLGGSELPVGETVIATSRGGNSVISSAVLSNRKAKPVSVGIAGKSIPTGIAGIDASGQWRIATVGGTLVAQGNGNAQAASAAARLPKGIYIINIEGKSSVKFSIK